MTKRYTEWPEQPVYDFEDIRQMQQAINAMGVTRFGRPARVRMALTAGGNRAEVVTLDGCGVMRLAWSGIAYRLNTRNGAF